jgi:hypothetical protein
MQTMTFGFTDVALIIIIVILLAAMIRGRL